MQTSARRKKAFSAFYSGGARLSKRPEVDPMADFLQMGGNGLTGEAGLWALFQPINYAIYMN